MLAQARSIIRLPRLSRFSRLPRKPLIKIVPGIIIKPRARILHGHDWDYGTQILKTFANPQGGDVVSIKDGRDRLLGTAIYNPASQIPARRISHSRVALDREFLARRLARALDWRTKAACRADLCRLVWSDADGLPGVIADRYADTIVLQTLTLAMDNHKQTIAEELQKLTAVRCVVERNDAPIRHAEGLEPSVSTLLGDAPAPFPVTANGVTFEVDVLGGQKTGLYLDQLDNAARIARHAAARTVLDCFSNQGNFALACARAGAAAVEAVESGTEAAARLRVNAARNALDVAVHEADVFTWLPRAAKASGKWKVESGKLEQPPKAGSQTFNLIIIDPPSFTKSRGRIHDALRGYRELHRHAAALLAPDGLLATFCCSHHVSASEFEHAVAEGLADARRSFFVLERLDQPADHPIALHLPETRYLKGLLLALRPSI